MYTGFEKLQENATCPVCDSACYNNNNPEHELTTMVVCPVCGKFRFRSSFVGSFLAQRERGLGYRLSHYLRSVSERAIGKRDNSFFPVYTPSEFEAMAENTEPSVNEKLQILLRFLGTLSDHPGQQVDFDSANDYSVLCAKNRDEAEFYLRALDGQGLVSAGALLTGALPCMVTSAGWQEIERIEQSGSASSNGFIAMWFDPSQDAVKQAIRSAIESAGYVPVRIDQIEHVNRIDDEIIARIRQSKFLVADLTGQRTGVYFEAGFMLGLGRPVVWLCHESELGNVHFDTRQYNTIVYKDAEELKSKLQFRIEAIMGKGSHAKDA